MPAKVIGHEGGDEVVAVVVARLHPQRQRLARFPAGRFQQVGAEEWDRLREQYGEGQPS